MASSDFAVVVCVDVGSANLLRYVSVPICVFIRLCISLFLVCIISWLFVIMMLLWLDNLNV